MNQLVVWVIILPENEPVDFITTIKIQCDEVFKGHFSKSVFCIQF